MKKIVAYLGVVLYGVISTTLVGAYLQYVFYVPLTLLKDWLSTFYLQNEYIYSALFGIPMAILFSPALGMYRPLKIKDWSKDVHWSAYILPVVSLLIWLINAIVLSWTYDGIHVMTRTLTETIYLLVIGGYNIFKVVEYRKGKDD